MGRFLFPDELPILNFGCICHSKRDDTTRRKTICLILGVLLHPPENVLSPVDCLHKQNKLVFWQLKTDGGTAELWHSGLLLLSGSLKSLWKQLKGRVQRWHLLLKSVLGRQLGKIWRMVRTRYRESLPEKCLTSFPSVWEAGFGKP